MGYDYVLSIEHEDSLMSPREGLKKAVTFFKEDNSDGKAGTDVVGIISFRMEKR